MYRLHLYFLFYLATMTKITAEDRILIKHLRIEKQWGARRITNEFPNKAWSIASNIRVINNIEVFKKKRYNAA